jgi:hypothetical protein
MAGKSKLTADAAEQATLRDLSKSEQRDEADRARAILLTLDGQRAEAISPHWLAHQLRQRVCVAAGRATPAKGAWTKTAVAASRERLADLKA